jgi:hypothetical protein
MNGNKSGPAFLTQVKPMQLHKMELEVERSFLDLKKSIKPKGMNNHDFSF